MRSVGASGRHCIVYAISGHGCSPLRCRGTPPYGASRKFERYSPECVEKLSEKSRRHPKLGLRRHPKGTVRPVLVPEQRPNPRSEHCSYPFSDSFGETVWKIAEGVTSAILWRQEATDRDSLDSSRPLSEPRFGTHSDFPNSFGRGILRSSRSGVLRSSRELEPYNSTRSTH